MAVAIILLPNFIIAQDLIQFPAPSLELSIEQSGGKNGASVAYNPDQQVYYCVIAGNATYPLETFDKNGRNVYQSKAYNDMRGIWWNSKTNALEGNCYLDGGIVSIGITDRGYAGTGNKVVFSGSDYQPNDQAVGTYDPKKKEILYYDEGRILGYSRKDGSPTDTYILLSLPVDNSDINWTTLLFTGKKKMELGVLDVYNKKVYLFDRKDGSHTGTVSLPSSATVYDAFNFSYANDYIFLFDQSSRKWIGYKIF